MASAPNICLAGGALHATRFFPGTAGVSPACSRDWAEGPAFWDDNCRRSADSSGHAGGDAGAPREIALLRVDAECSGGRYLGVVTTRHTGLASSIEGNQRKRQHE